MLTRHQEDIIKDEWIPKDQMQQGVRYECKGRGIKTGVWNGKAFEYMNIMGKSSFKDMQFHWDDGPPFGTVKPYRIKEKN